MIKQIGCFRKDVFGVNNSSNGTIEEILDTNIADCNESIEEFKGPNNYNDSELVFGLVGAVGTNLRSVSEIIKDRLKSFSYKTDIIQVSEDVIGKLHPDKVKNSTSEYERIENYINLGNEVREKTGDHSVLALGAASVIMSKRDKDEASKTTKPKKRIAYVINSLKHPSEVNKLREIYSTGFYLIGVHSDEQRRLEYLNEDKEIEYSKAELLIKRDEDEVANYGQHTRKVFQMADFFVNYDGDTSTKLKKSIWRILDLIFGNPFLTPTFDEFAMFTAFTSALRSADLSRQVGAVIAKNNEIISSGANDCPQYGGGLYWPYLDNKTNEIVDYEGGRDYKIGYDSNKKELNEIVDDIISHIKTDKYTDQDIRKIRERILDSKIKDITEYGRVVHAEMEALLMCARNNISTKDAILYCTTFPCHNCAKHIIAAGIKRVVYIEPYPKSKAFKFHSESICSTESGNDLGKVNFEAFIGIGPRKFFELFSLSLSSGYNIIRKDESGKKIEWNRKGGVMRVQLQPISYLERESSATLLYDKLRSGLVE